MPTPNWPIGATAAAGSVDACPDSRRVSRRDAHLASSLEAAIEGPNLRESARFDAGAARGACAHTDESVGGASAREKASRASLARPTQVRWVGLREMNMREARQPPVSDGTTLGARPDAQGRRCESPKVAARWHFIVGAPCFAHSLVETILLAGPQRFPEISCGDRSRAIWRLRCLIACVRLTGLVHVAWGHAEPVRARIERYFSASARARIAGRLKALARPPGASGSRWSRHRPSATVTRALRFLSACRLDRARDVYAASALLHEDEAHAHDAEPTARHE